MAELKECPFCGGEADIEEVAGNPYTDESYAWGVGCKKCNIGWYEETREKAIAMWNRRAAPENKPLTLEELRKMDGEPAYVQEGDGTEGWAVVCWDSPETLFLYGPEFDPVFEPDLDFINMEYNDPDGHFGLHILGWRALRRKPEVSE